MCPLLGSGLRYGVKLFPQESALASWKNIAQLNTLLLIMLAPMLQVSGFAKTMNDWVIMDHQMAEKMEHQGNLAGASESYGGLRGVSLPPK